MIYDKENQYSDAQAVTAAAASTNLIDHQAARDLGVGEELYLVVHCVVAMTDAGSDSTLAVVLQTDDNVGFASASQLMAVGTFPAVSAVGTRFVVKLPAIGDNAWERFTRLLFTPANGDLSTGSFDAFLTKNPQLDKAYPSGVTIS